jgi:outer membrane autotransporter protein
MIKSAFAALAAAPLFAGAAMAGPYVNIEANSGFTGSDYSGTTTDFHVGYEGTEGALGYYIQGGPSLVSPDGAASDTVFSGKVGASVAATEQLGVYGEFALSTGANGAKNGYATKAGVKYAF